MLTSQPINYIGQSLTGLETPYEEFNFYYRPPGWKRVMHRHTFFQFLLVIDGDLSITIDERTDLLTRGMISLIPPEIPHFLITEKGYHQFGINFFTDPKDPLIRILYANIKVPAVINMPRLLDNLAEIENCTRLQTMVSIQKIRNRFENMILTCVDMLNKQDDDQAFQEKLMEYLRGHISENLTLEDLSGYFYMSASHIERLSYREFGCGAIHLFHKLKIDQARLLLQNTDLRISEIAAHLGYEDQGYFTRLFGKYVGTSPRKYQKWRTV